MARHAKVTAIMLSTLLFSVGAASVSASPRSDYLLHCGGCHLENGQGTPPEVPDLRVDLEWLARFPEGRAYLTRVPGASQVPISDARLAALFNWIFETYYPASADIEPYTAEEIGRSRYDPLYDPLKARKALGATALKSD